MAQQNPRSTAALTTDDICPNLRFTWYVPGRLESVEHGIFLSHPYEDDRGDLIVDLRLDSMATHRAYDLATLGITPTPDGRWLDAMTVSEED